jgi:hypothetical protein
MIPLTLALSLQGRGDIIGSSLLRGEGWERVQNEYYLPLRLLQKSYSGSRRL